MRPLTIDWIARTVNAVHTSGAKETEVCAVHTDSREVQTKSLFVARKGTKINGRTFIDQALASGAAAILCDFEDGDKARKFPAPVIFVENSTLALGALAREYRKTLSAKFIAITGSVGKTTIKEMLGTSLAPHCSLVRAKSSFNNEVGVPLTILAANDQTEVVIVEAGTNAPGEIDYLGSLINPDITLITAVGASHLSGLKDIESVAAEKASLLKHLRPGGVGIFNGDDLRVRAMADTLRQARGKDSVLTVGFRPNNDISGTPLSDMTEVPDSGKPGSHSRMRLDSGAILSLQIPGQHMQRNALFVVAVADLLKLNRPAVLEKLAHFQALPGRLSLQSAGPSVIFDDCYNANPSSMKAAIECVTTFAQQRDKIAILGSMLELGKHSEAHHRALGRLIARSGFSALITVGQEAHAIAAEAQSLGVPRERVHSFVNAGEAARSSLLEWAEPETVFLVKGSRRIGLEKLIKTLKLTRQSSSQKLLPVP